MADKKPTIKLWSVKEGKLLAFELSSDGTDIIATRGDEAVKFPGGLTKEEFLTYAEEHNEVNKNLKAVSAEQIKADEERAEANASLLDSLK